MWLSCWCRHRKTGRDKRERERESYLFSIYFFFFDFYHKSYSSSSLIVHSWQMNAAASWPFILLVVCFLILFSSSLNLCFVFFLITFSSPSAAGQRPAQQSVVGAPFFSAIAVVMIVTVTCFLAMDHHGRVTSASPLMATKEETRNNNNKNGRTLTRNRIALPYTLYTKKYPSDSYRV